MGATAPHQKTAGGRALPGVTHDHAVADAIVDVASPDGAFLAIGSAAVR